ncbi:MAG: GIY-YIG nuclease family protein [Cyclobacteriaceae bacterium]
MHRTYTVYIPLCANGQYHTGVTNDIDRRMHEHQAGINEGAFTANKRPVQLVFQENFNHIKEAIDFEKQVKGWRRAKKEALINDEWDKLPELSKSYTDGEDHSSTGSEGRPLLSNS